MRQFNGIVFDAYGTLLDVGSVAAVCEQTFPGAGTALTHLWRQRQLEYSWLRSLMGRYSDFWQITGEALAYSCAALGLPAEPMTLETLRAAYLTLAPFPEVATALEGLAPHRRLVLSNGTMPMLAAGLGHAGLLDQLEAILSVEAAGIFKPSPQVYALATDYLDCAPGEVLFVSSNGWDIAGAASYGFQTCWLNRSAAPLDRLGITPTLVVADLGALVSQLATDEGADQ